MNKGQKVSHSLYEVAANISTGMLLAAVVNHYIIFPMIGVTPELKWDFLVTLIMTVFSVVRSFVFRRIFNWLMLRSAKP